MAAGGSLCVLPSLEGEALRRQTPSERGEVTGAPGLGPGKGGTWYSWLGREFLLTELPSSQVKMFAPLRFVLKQVIKIWCTCCTVFCFVYTYVCV